jgi:hypothetical protein
MSLQSWLEPLEILIENIGDRLGIEPAVIGRSAVAFLAVAGGGVTVALAVFLLQEPGEEVPTATATVIVPAPALVREPQPGTRPAPSSLDQPPAGDRRALTRALHAELKRVGCYKGRIKRRWSARSRKAMQAFTTRVNAVLPVDEPDQILLALVQAHPEQVCGVPEVVPVKAMPPQQKAELIPEELDKPAKPVEPVAVAAPGGAASSEGEEKLAAKSGTVPQTPRKSQSQEIAAAPVIVDTPKPKVQKASKSKVERRARRVRRKKKFGPPPAARAVMRNLKKLERALGGAFP